MDNANGWTNYAFIGNTAANDLNIATGGGNIRMTVLSTGNIGIGTTIPQSQLSIGSVPSGARPTYSGRITLQNNGGLNTNNEGIEFLTSDWENGFGWKISAWDEGTGETPLVIGTRSNSASWSETLRLKRQTIIATQTYSVAVGATKRALYIDNTGLIGYDSSTIKQKENVLNIEPIDWIYQLRPVNFTFKTDDLKSKQYGLIAEEVELINSNFVSYDNIEEEIGGEKIKIKVPATVSYNSLIIPLLAAVQEQKKIIDTQSLTIEDLITKINKIENK